MIILWIAILILVGTAWYFYAKARKTINKAKDMLSDGESMLRVGVVNGKDLVKNLTELDGVVCPVSEKSVPTATKLYLPRNEIDFPAFNWADYKIKIQKAVKAYIEEELEGTEPSIHRTEIANYISSSVSCSIETQTSAGYKAKGGETVEQRFVVIVVYKQVVEKPEGKTMAIHCPNCGAPIMKLGLKICLYCKTALFEVTDRVWEIQSVMIG